MFAIVLVRSDFFSCLVLRLLLLLSQIRIFELIIAFLQLIAIISAEFIFPRSAASNSLLNLFYSPTLIHTFLCTSHIRFTADYIAFRIHLKP